MARSHTGAGGYVFEHRLVVARALGRDLLPSEEVHHVDGNRANNDLSNLQLPNDFPRGRDLDALQGVRIARCCSGVVALDSAGILRRGARAR